MRSNWKQFNFKYGQAYFQYFKGTETAKAEGQVLTSQITKVESCISKYTGEFPFEVHSTSKGSPWLLCASSEEERISWMEAIKPGSAAHLRPPPQSHQPPVNLATTWPLVSGGGGVGLPAKRDAQLPYVLHPGQQQPVLQQSQWQPQAYQPQPPTAAEPPHRTPSQHSLHHKHLPEAGSVSAAEPYMLPGDVVTTVIPSSVITSSIATPAATTPPITPARSGSAHLIHARTFPESDTDSSGYMKLEPVSIPNPPLTKRRTEIQIPLNPEESPSPTTPTSGPVTPVSTVVDMMRHMSSEQMQMLVQMLSNLDVGGAKTPESVSVQPPQLLKMISQTPDLGDALLITEDDEQYEPRPEWAKANASSAEDDLGQSSDLQKEALFISSSSLSDHVSIGKGQFGEVFRATLHKGTPGEVLVAVKTTKKNSSEKDKADFLKEMTVMSTLLHPNIVRLYGLVNENQESSSIVLEYLPNGDLKHFLTANPRPTKQLVKYMIDVAMGMHYISERGLVHRDLAARNVLVGENEVCKVADFGLLRELPEENSIYQSTANAPLPVRWMAPESIKGKKFSVASDVWSYGILMWEMFNPDKMPYLTFSNMECVMKVSEGYRLPPPRGTPPIVVRLMRACWHKQPEKRPSFLIISTLLTTKAFAEIEMSSSSKS
eukprot:Em0023g550a